MNNKTQQRSTEATFAWCLAAIVLFVPAALWNGYCLSIIWSWLIVPSFDAPPIATAPMACASFFMAAIRAKYGVKQETHDIGTVVVAMFLGPLIVLGIAWVLSFFLVGG